MNSSKCYWCGEHLGSGHGQEERQLTCEQCSVEKAQVACNTGRNAYGLPTLVPDWNEQRDTVMELVRRECERLNLSQLDAVLCFIKAIRHDGATLK